MRNETPPASIRMTIAVIGAFLLLFLALSVVDLAARERDVMSSEREARWPTYLGERFEEEQVIVKSLRAQEDRLYVNEEPFIVTHKTTMLDEKGRKLRPGFLWVGCLVELRYRSGPQSEARSYGPDDKVLVEMRILKRIRDDAKRGP